MVTAFCCSTTFRMSSGAPSEVKQFVQKLHSSGRVKVVLASAGAGASALTWLLAEPGASATVLEGLIPYNQKALQKFLAPSPLDASSKVVSAEVATSMAEVCAERAREYVGEGDGQAIGLAASAAISTGRERRGENKFFVSVATRDVLYTYGAVMRRNARTRSEEEGVVSRSILYALEKVIEGDKNAQILSTGLSTDEPMERSEQPRDVRTAVETVLRGKGDLAIVDTDGEAASSTRGFAGLVLCGSFNPLHYGHTRMLEAAKSLSGARFAAFELAVINPDKGSIPLGETLVRAAQFRQKAPLLITSASLFTEKMRLLPESDFVVGYDTAVRILNPKYYGGTEQMITMLTTTTSRIPKFYVAGRLDKDQARFLSLNDISVPPELSDSFIDIPESLFREDISSTELRAKLAKN